jgi:DNA-binding transcriptional LysR family regulator
MDRLDDIEAFLNVVEKGSLTAAARHLGRSLQSISRSLATLERSVAVDLIGDARREAASRQVGLTVIAELVVRHPRLEIELRVSDREVDLLAGRLDMAVRIRELRDSSLKARRLGEVRPVVFGAPSYFQRHGRPRHPDELKDHDCVVRLTDGDPEAWPFCVAGRRWLVRVGGRLRTEAPPRCRAAPASASPRSGWCAASSIAAR